MERSKGLKRLGEYVTGEIPGTMPFGIRSAITAPQKVYEGKLPVYVNDERGRQVFNPEAIKAGAEVAGLVSSGTLATKPNPNMVKIGYNQYKKDVGKSFKLTQNKIKNMVGKFSDENDFEILADLFDSDLIHSEVLKGLEATPRAWTRPTKSVEVKYAPNENALGEFHLKPKLQTLNAIKATKETVPHEFQHGVELFADQIPLKKVPQMTQLSKDVWKNRQMMKEIGKINKNHNLNMFSKVRHHPEEYMAYKLMRDFTNFKQSTGRRPTTKEAMQMWKQGSDDYIGAFYKKLGDTEYGAELKRWENALNKVTEKKK